MAQCQDCIHYEICDEYVSPCESFPETDGCRCFKDKADFASKSEVEQIFKEIEVEIQEALNSNYRAKPHIAESEELYRMVEGKITALSGVQDFVAELKKKYIPTEGE